MVLAGTNNNVHCINLVFELGLSGWRAGTLPTQYSNSVLTSHRQAMEPLWGLNSNLISVRIYVFMN